MLLSSLYFFSRKNILQAERSKCNKRDASGFIPGCVTYENALDCCNRYPWDIISINPDGSGKTTLVSGVLTAGYEDNSL